MIFRKLPGICSTHQGKYTHARARTHTHTHTRTLARAYTHCVAKCRVSWCNTGDTYNYYLVLGCYTNGQKNSILCFIIPQVLTLYLIYSAFASFCQTLFSAILIGNSVRRAQANREHKQN